MCLVAGKYNDISHEFLLYPRDVQGCELGCDSATSHGFLPAAGIMMFSEWLKRRKGRRNCAAVCCKLGSLARLHAGLTTSAGCEFSKFSNTPATFEFVLEWGGRQNGNFTRANEDKPFDFRASPFWDLICVAHGPQPSGALMKPCRCLCESLCGTCRRTALHFASVRDVLGSSLIMMMYGYVW